MSDGYRRGTSLATRSLATTPLPKCSVLLLLYTLSLIVTFPANAQAVVDGGLTATEVGWSLGANLLVNGDFSQGTAGWTLPSNCFSLDPTTPAPNGAGSLLMSDSATCNNLTPVAVNSLKVAERAGVHAERRAQDRKHCRHQVLLGRDVRSARLRAFTDHRRHHRLDQHDAAAHNRPRGSEHLGASADLRCGDAAGARGLRTCRSSRRYRRRCRCSCSTRTTAA